MIGKRALDDPRNRLVYHSVRIVSELKPKYFIFENVRGLTVGEHKKFLSEIIAEFKAQGYKVQEDYQVLNAVNFGVPQDRQRLFLMGARKGQRLPEYPVKTHELPGANLDLGFTETTPTVWEALGDLPEADDYEELLERDWVEADFAKPSRYAKLLRFGAGKTHALLTSSLRTIHTPLSRKRFEATAPGDTEPVSRFPQARSEWRMQYHPRRHGERSRCVHFSASDSSLLSKVHYRQGSSPPAFIPGLVPVPRHEVAWIPAGGKLSPATSRARGGLEDHGTSGRKARN